MQSQSPLNSLAEPSEAISAVRRVKHTVNGKVNTSTTTAAVAPAAACRAQEDRVKTGLNRVIQGETGLNRVKSASNSLSSKTLSARVVFFSSRHRHSLCNGGKWGVNVASGGDSRHWRRFDLDLVVAGEFDRRHREDAEMARHTGACQVNASSREREREGEGGHTGPFEHRSRAKTLANPTRQTHRVGRRGRQNNGALVVSRERQGIVNAEPVRSDTGEFTQNTA